MTYTEDADTEGKDEGVLVVSERAGDDSTLAMAARGMG